MSEKQVQCCSKMPFPDHVLDEGSRKIKQNRVALRIDSLKLCCTNIVQKPESDQANENVELPLPEDTHKECPTHVCHPDPPAAQKSLDQLMQV